jgi:membrane protein DedA with SNARE-associated domain
VFIFFADQRNSSAPIMKQETTLPLSPDQLHHLIATYGVWVVALVVAIESIGIPLPGEAVLVAASIYAATHGGSIELVIAAAAAGAIIGDNIGFLIGRSLGYPILVKFGPRLGITEGRIKLGQYLFREYGSVVVFIGRFFAVLRCLAAFLAGANQMAWARFLVANAAGALVWAGIVGISAYTLGRSIHEVHGPVAIAGICVAVALVAGVFWYLRRHEAELQQRAEIAIPGPIRAQSAAPVAKQS